MKRRSKDNFIGCLVGGAVGDALGAAIEFDTLSTIRRKFGPSGLTDYAPAYGRVGAITDDTQMTLFTAEALIRADNRGKDRGLCPPVAVARNAYQRWLLTQGYELDIFGEPGWLVQQRGLHDRRAPGNTCISALAAGGKGTATEPANDSKGCGGVMRMAPVGLAVSKPFETGCDFAAITHGHPSGYISAGAFALIISELCDGKSLVDAISVTLHHLVGCGDKGRETLKAIEGAVKLAGRGVVSAEEIETLGGAWVGEEALAISLYCTLVAKDFAEGMFLSINHSGDSDSTGSITGNILGLIHGIDDIPKRWRDQLELNSLIEEVSTDLWLHFGESEKPEGYLNNDLYDRDKYPGN